MTVDPFAPAATYEQVYGPDGSSRGAVGEVVEPLDDIAGEHVEHDTDAAAALVPTGATRRRHSPQPFLDPAALYGLVGELVQVVGPHTEADPVALLVTFLTAFGAAVGRGPHALADGAEHPARLFTVLVGPTSKSRKGTSWAQVRRVLTVADVGFIGERVLSGFGSGEAIVDTVAESEDKRLLIQEPEWSRLLAVSRREGATLSQLARQAWDGDRLAVRSRSAKAVAEGAHVTVLGHITQGELRSKLLELDLANGFANRHLFILVQRSKLLPCGGNLHDRDVTALGRKVEHALRKARSVGIMRRTPEAEKRWDTLYRTMARDDPGNLVGAVIARDAAQVLRLSVAYALTDGSSRIELPHLEAAWAVWRYSRQSVHDIFAKRTSDPVADKLLDALRAAGVDGLDGTQQRDVFGRHVGGRRLAGARELLEMEGLIVTSAEPTQGRPRLVSVAT